MAKAHGFDTVRVSSKSRSITVLNDLAGMWLIFLEAGVALALLIFIVWWTWPSKVDDKNDKEQGND